MKHLIITSLLVFSSIFVKAEDKLIFVKVEDQSHLFALFENKDLTIHHYTDSYIIASLKNDAKLEIESFILDEKAFSDTHGYYIVYCPISLRYDYFNMTEKRGKVLYFNDDFLLMKPTDENNQLIPAKNDGMVYISNRKASLPPPTINFPTITEINPIIQYLTQIVNGDSIMASVQHLQNYGTRVYHKPQAYQAQDWISEKLNAMGLDVEIHNFSAAGNWWGLPSISSGNVIAVQTGTTFPNEYIVCGAHYDSFVPWNYDNCPGADDNATGTAGILEIARILSQFEFERTIIYCLFSAEEVGLFGSQAYASRCSQQGMNILGYFNIDMSGYSVTGKKVNISLIYPSTAVLLANYYTNIANIYFSSVNISHHASIPGGDSDHTSFNQNGYYGIYPFENLSNYSPYIHTANDVIGLSVNSPTQCRIYAQLAFASISTLAGLIYNTLLPIPYFSVSETEITAGNTVQFTDLSTNEPTEWNWFFEGGTPPESVEQHPEIMYNTPGNFSVKLIVSNAYGSDSLILTNYISVEGLPLTYNVFGRVIDEHSEPMSGAVVTIDGFETFSTASDGIFEFNNLEINSYTITITKENYEDYFTTFTVENEDVDLGDIVMMPVPPPTFKVFGRVINENNEPISEFLFSLVSNFGIYEGYIISAGGSFEIPVQGNNNYSFTIMTKNYKDYFTTFAVENEDVNLGDIVLIPISSVTFPAPQNFIMDYHYFMIDESGICGGEIVIGATYCTTFWWDAPDVSETDAQLTGYNIYYYPFGYKLDEIPYSEGSIIFQTTNTYVQLEIGIIGYTWVTAIYTEPDGESEPSNYQFNEDLPISVNEVKTKQYSIFHNKQKNGIEINGIENITLIEVFSLDGIEIISVKNSDFSFINTKNCNKGVYLIKIQTSGGKIITDKIIIK